MCEQYPFFVTLAFPLRQTKGTKANFLHSALLSLNTPMPLSQKLGLTLILLVAAGVRLYGLNNISPPGLAHDEVAHWLINEQILAGHHAVYFTDAYGHEAGFHYWQTLFALFLGDNALALRLPAAVLGLWGVALTYPLTKLLFGQRTAVWAMALSAVLLVGVFNSRLALRGIALPFTAGLSAYFWWKYWLLTHQPSYATTKKYLYLGLAAGWAGLSTYTYMASRALPIFYGVFFLYLALFHWSHTKKQLGEMALFALIYLLISLPLWWFIRTVPEADVRIGEVDAPMRAFLAGDPWPALHNLWALVLMFGFSGDPLWRQNVAYQPLFEPVVAALFYLGVLLSFIRLKEARYAFLLIWLGAAVLPSVMTVDAPSSLRAINILPVVVILPFIVIPKKLGLSPVFPNLSTGQNKNLGITFLTFVLLMFYGWQTGRAILTVWPHETSEVRFVWQAALTQMAGFLDIHPEVRQATIVGWTPETMDAPTMDLTLKREDVGLRYTGQVGEVQTLILPNLATTPAEVLRPAVLPLNYYLEEWLITSGAPPQKMGEFVRYTVPAGLPLAPEHLLDTTFGTELRLVGYTIYLNPPFEQLELLTFWEVLETPPAGRRLFLHLVDNTGQMLGQYDGLSAPSQFWRPGDTLVQYHAVPNVNIPFELRLGAYDPQPPWPRLLTPAGADFVILD